MKEKSFQQMVLVQLAIHMPKNEFGHLPHTIHENYSKMDQDLNVRAKSIKLIEENMGLNLYDFGLGNSF